MHFLLFVFFLGFHSNANQRNHPRHNKGENMVLCRSLSERKHNENLFVWNNICIINVCKRHIIHLCIICIDLLNLAIFLLSCYEVNLWHFSGSLAKQSKIFFTENFRKCFLFSPNKLQLLTFVGFQVFNKQFLCGIYSIKPFRASLFQQRVVQRKTFFHFPSPIDIHFPPSFICHTRNNHNLKNHVFAAATFTCFLLSLLPSLFLSLSLCFNSIKHKAENCYYDEIGKLFSPSPRSRFCTDFEWEANLMALFQGWNFLPDLFPPKTHVEA